MFTEILKKEIQEHIMRFRFLAGMVICLTMVSLSVIIGIRDYNARLKTYYVAQKIADDALRQTTVYSYLSPKISRPPSILSIIAKGRDADFARPVDILFYEVPVLEASSSDENPYLANFFHYDLTEVVKIILGLLAVLFAFDAICGEKEQGTLRLILSNPTGRSTLCIAKIAGGLTVLLIPVLISLMAAVCAILFFADGAFLPDHWVRLGMIFGVYLIYLSIMYLAGLGISMLTGKRSTASVLCLMFWLLAAIVVPNVGAFVGERLLSVPPRQSVQRSLQEMTWWASHNKAKLRFLHPLAYDYYLKRYSFNNQAILKQAWEQYEVLADYERKLDKEAQTARRCAGFSPAYLSGGIVQQLASTSIEDIDYFMAGARRYRQEVINYVKGKRGFSTKRWFTDDPPGTEPFIEDPIHFQRSQLDKLIKPDWKERAEKSQNDPARRLDLRDMPRFRYQTRSISAALKHALPIMGILVFILGFLFIFNILRLQGYDIR